MRYKAVIWDLDGTLLDTLQDLYTSCNYTMRYFSYPERTLDEVRMFVGNGVKVLLSKASEIELDNPKIDEMYEVFREYYSIHCNDATRVYDGIYETIDALKELGIVSAIVSNKPQYGVSELKDKYFNGRISVAIGETQEVRHKPYPDTVIEACKQLNVNINDCVYVGDSEVDILTAKNCNIDCISGAWGFRSKEHLLANGANIICKNTKELYDEIVN